MRYRVTIMCGIIGYIGSRDAVPVLLDGLCRLEYRGYDSAGVAVMNDGSVCVMRAVGKVAALETALSKQPLVGNAGIGHTRWATHGAPLEKNAHPHTDCSGNIAIVHNGVIENAEELRRELQQSGHTFRSDTDTEVIAHLMEEASAPLEEMLRAALLRVRGTYGVAAVSEREPDHIVIARMGSPLVIGIGEHETFLASDVSAILGYTRDMVYLDDGEIAVLTREGYAVRSLENQPVTKRATQIEWAAEDVQKNGHPHFMLKEMLEQPDALRNTMRGRLSAEQGSVRLGGLHDATEHLREMERLVIVGCGSAYHSGLIGKRMLEEVAGIPTEVEVASEFLDRAPWLSPRTVVLAVSQSGETADTLAAIRFAKQQGAYTLGMVNVVGSTIARETDAGVYNHAGPEIGVASTKAFISQATAFALMSAWVARLMLSSRASPRAEGSGTLGPDSSATLRFGRDDKRIKQLTDALSALPDLVAKVLKQHEQIKQIASRYASAKNFLFLGRGRNAPVALEGALKLKEISYIHAEGYPAGEMKHGPLALIDADFPTIAICPRDATFEKMAVAMEELRARGGPVIAVTTEGNEDVRRLASDVLFIPQTIELLMPLLAIIPLQLFAYEVAVANGLNPDQPRNLAKSVTVG